MFGPVSEGMRLFKNCSHVAVVGYSEKPERVVSKVTQYLISEGNRITGVNPNLTEAKENKIPIKARLADIEGATDVIQIFRNSAALPQLAREIRALSWRPKLVWCQQGVIDLNFQREMEKAGILVVMDACPYALRSFL